MLTTKEKIAIFNEIEDRASTLTANSPEEFVNRIEFGEGATTVTLEVLEFLPYCGGTEESYVYVPLDVFFSEDNLADWHRDMLIEKREKEKEFLIARDAAADSELRKTFGC